MELYIVFANLNRIMTVYGLTHYEAVYLTMTKIPHFQYRLVCSVLSVNITLDLFLNDFELFASSRRYETLIKLLISSRILVHGSYIIHIEIV